ncbi:uncharacterized protein LOC106064018 isoform X1 [Biomphalaria glabrata]|uniref:Uncharacterized protein LOC106064018 isoform X1 n=1 Tax=Biomphalaria glabrata TaxID=6526 RepID=A0A9W3AY11_BIOGL|nr:uncharacterized protein LOC106064018 isoform X1 [Biomphalaria glabrata]
MVDGGLTWSVRGGANTINQQDVYQGIIVARRLRNFDIEIFQEDPRNLANFPNITGEVCYHQNAPLEPGTFNFTCPVPIIGRFVRLVMRPSASDVIHICELEVLASSSRVQDFYYTLKENTELQGTPLDEMTFRDSSSCLQECLQRRSTDYCTAFNWVTSTRLCRLFSVNPSLSITANLTFVLGTYFYIEISTFG